jgi:hypothetical protein
VTTLLAFLSPALAGSGAVLLVVGLGPLVPSWWRARRAAAQWVGR